MYRCIEYKTIDNLPVNTDRLPDSYRYAKTLAYYLHFLSHVATLPQVIFSNYF